MLRKLLKEKNADMNLILTAIVMAIVFGVGILIVFNVIASIDTSEIDDGFSGTPAMNSSVDLLTNVETFYTVGPIALIVVAAVGILSYVLLLRRRG